MEIVLVAVGAGDDPDRRPPAAGAGTMPAVGHLAGQVAGAIVTRIATVPDPPLIPDLERREGWADQRIHRLVRRPPWEASEALHRVLRDGDGSIVVAADRTRRRSRSARRYARRAGARRQVRLDLAPSGPPLGLPRLDGSLRVRRWGRSTPVEVTLAPWSALRTHLCLRPRRGRFGVRLPRRYYDVAHRVMDELWHQIERAPTG